MASMQSHLYNVIVILMTIKLEVTIARGNAAVWPEVVIPPDCKYQTRMKKIQDRKVVYFNV